MEESNIKWVGPGEPLTEINIGMLRIQLPPADEQADGFYHEHARKIVACARGYQLIVGHH